MYLRTLRSLKSEKQLGPQVAKKNGSTIANPQIATFAEGPLIKENLLICDLLNLFAGRVWCKLIEAGCWDLDVRAGL
jgi:hypothetical protein